MNSDWQTFLTQQGASVDSTIVQHFGDPAAELTATEQGTVLCALGQFATLRASGIDAQAWLQNLLSNDIREVTGSRAQWSSFNTAKGRMLATFLIWRDGDDYLLQLPATLADTLRQKLGMYVLRARVKLTDASNDLISLGLSGENAQTMLLEHCPELPQQPLEMVKINDQTDLISLGLSGENAQTMLLEHCPELPQQPLEMVKINDQTGNIIRLNDTRFQLNTTPEHAQTLWRALSGRAKSVGSPCWDWLNVRAGIPFILPQTQEQFVPQMANLDLLGGINFKKGCYPGQEIVARMHYLGKLKRRMYLAHVECDVAPQAGDAVFSADMADQQPAQPGGMIANSAAAPSGGYDVLAVVQISSRETQTLHLKSRQGAILTFASLPYPLP